MLGAERITKLERSPGAAELDPAPEEVFNLMGVKTDAEVADFIYADSPAGTKLRVAKEQLLKGNYNNPIVRDCLRGGAHIAALIINDGRLDEPKLQFDDAAREVAKRHYVALRTLAGLDFADTSKGVPLMDFHPSVTFSAEDVTQGEITDSGGLFDALMSGISRIVSVDARGEMSGEAQRLFEDFDFDNDPESFSYDAKYVLSRLQSYDVFYMSREQLAQMPSTQLHMIAVGSDTNRADDDDSSTSAAIDSGGHSVHALRGAQIPPGFEEYTRTIARPGGGDEIVLELYAAKRVKRDFILYAAFGHPRTLADVTAEQMNIPPTIHNRIARFCRRIDAIIRVGRDPTVLVQFDWNIPAEVLRTIVEERIRVGRPLTVQDLLFIEDAHIMA